MKLISNTRISFLISIHLEHANYFFYSWHLQFVFVVLFIFWKYDRILWDNNAQNSLGLLIHTKQIFQPWMSICGKYIQHTKRDMILFKCHSQSLKSKSIQFNHTKGKLKTSLTIINGEHCVFLSFQCGLWLSLYIFQCYITFRRLSFGENCWVIFTKEKSVDKLHCMILQMHETG